MNMRCAPFLCQPSKCLNKVSHDDGVPCSFQNVYVLNIKNCLTFPLICIKYGISDGSAIFTEH